MNQVAFYCIPEAGAALLHPEAEFMASLEAQYYIWWPSIPAAAAALVLHPEVTFMFSRFDLKGLCDEIEIASWTLMVGCGFCIL